MAGQGKSWGKHAQRCVQDQRGAVAVEFALVLPLLSMLLFGIVTFGFAFSDKIALVNAVREGGRFGASANSEDSQWANNVVTRTVQLYANADSPLTPSQVCAVLWTDHSGVNTAKWQSDPSCTSGTTAAGDGPSAPSGVADGSCFVTVWAAKPADLNWLLHTTTVTLSTQSVSFYQRVTSSCPYNP